MQVDLVFREGGMVRNRCGGVLLIVLQYPYKGIFNPSQRVSRAKSQDARHRGGMDTLRRS